MAVIGIQGRPVDLAGETASSAAAINTSTTKLNLNFFCIMFFSCDFLFQSIVYEYKALIF
jgi:hypothetical protein